MNVPARSARPAESNCELDSHADTTAAGPNMILLEDQAISHVDVHPFSPEYAPVKDIPIGTCVTAYTDPNGKVWLIYFHETLYFGDRLQHSLICPNQIRDCDHNRVDETPRQFDTKSSHSIHIENIVEDGETQPLDIKLMLEGVVSYFTTRKPTKFEMETCDHVIATRDVPWNPASRKFQQAETAIDQSHPYSRDPTLVAALGKKQKKQAQAATTHQGWCFDSTLERNQRFERFVRNQRFERYGRNQQFERYFQIIPL